MQTFGMDLLHDGSSSNGYGLDLKLGYRHYFYDHFGLGFGIRYQEYESSAILNYRQETPGAQFLIAEPGFENYTYIADFMNFEERQTAQMLELPIEIFTQWNISRRWKLGIALGLQGNFMDVNNKYQHVSGKISTKGYIEQTNTTIEPLPGVPGGIVDEAHGYHFVDSVAVPNGKYKFDLSVSGIGALSFTYAINYHLDFMLNMNAAYGISRVCQNYSGRQLYNPDCLPASEDAAPKYNGRYEGMFNTQVAKPHLLSLGASVGFRYRFGKETPLELEFEDARRRRHLRETEGFDFVVTDSLEFDEVKRRRRQQEQDSIELADKERRRRQTDGLDIEIAADSLAADSLSNIVNTDAIGRDEQVSDSLVSQTDNNPNPPEEEDPLAALDRVMAKLNDNNCDFNKNDANQISTQAVYLDELADLLIAHPDITIHAYGHTCNIGSMEANKKVGMKRALAIKAELVSRGVSDSQVRCHTKWYSEPLVPNTTPENRAKNRRYELKRE